jgi:hypothetical protein
MAVASQRSIAIVMTGDIAITTSVSAAQNTNAPGDVDVFSLALGANTITLPTGGTAPLGATIVPPPGNTQALTLKGIAGDTGIPIHKTDPTSISFDASAPPASFVLNSAGVVNGLRVIWT